MFLVAIQLFENAVDFIPACIHNRKEGGLSQLVIFFLACLSVLLYPSESYFE